MLNAPCLKALVRAALRCATRPLVARRAPAALERQADAASWHGGWDSLENADTPGRSGGSTAW